MPSNFASKIRLSNTGVMTYDNSSDENNPTTDGNESFSKLSPTSKNAMSIPMVGNIKFSN